MSKAILVIDMPSECIKCPFQAFECCHPLRKEIPMESITIGEKPDWCPLSHPLKRVGHDYYIYDRKYLLDNLDREMDMLKKVRDYEYSTEARDTQ